MRHVGWNDERFSGAHGEDATVAHGEAEGAFEDVRDLLVLVAVLRHEGAFAENDAGEHGALTINELAVDEGIQMLNRQAVKTDVLDVFGVWQGGFSGDGGVGFPGAATRLS